MKKDFVTFSILIVVIKYKNFKIFKINNYKISL